MEDRVSIYVKQAWSSSFCRLASVVSSSVLSAMADSTLAAFVTSSALSSRSVASAAVADALGPAGGRWLGLVGRDGGGALLVRCHVAQPRHHDTRHTAKEAA